MPRLYWSLVHTAVPERIPSDQRKPEQTDIAWFAHIGGFLMGFLAAMLIRMNRRANQLGRALFLFLSNKLNQVTNICFETWAPNSRAL